MCKMLSSASRLSVIGDVCAVTISRKRKKLLLFLKLEILDEIILQPPVDSTHHLPENLVVPNLYYILIITFTVAIFFCNW